MPEAFPIKASDQPPRIFIGFQFTSYLSSWHSMRVASLSHILRILEDPVEHESAEHWG